MKMVNEKRLIDANDVYALFDKNGFARLHVGDIDTIPRVDAVEAVHGRWNMDKLEIGNPYDGNSTMIAEIGNCSICGYRGEMLPVMNYCPNCGAKMDGDGNGNA